jgi:hypothetical protein
LTGRTLNARYQARDGDVYLLRSSATGGVEVEVVPREKITR